VVVLVVVVMIYDDDDDDDDAHDGHRMDACASLTPRVCPAEHAPGRGSQLPPPKPHHQVRRPFSQRRLRCIGFRRLIAVVPRQKAKTLGIYPSA
jgi:hypothetical protein